MERLVRKLAVSGGAVCASLLMHGQVHAASLPLVDKTADTVTPIVTSSLQSLTTGVTNLTGSASTLPRATLHTLDQTTQKILPPSPGDTSGAPVATFQAPSVSTGTGQTVASGTLLPPLPRINSSFLPYFSAASPNRGGRISATEVTLATATVAAGGWLADVATVGSQVAEAVALVWVFMAALQLLKVRRIARWLIDTPTSSWLPPPLDAPVFIFGLPRRPGYGLITFHPP